MTASGSRPGENSLLTNSLLLSEICIDRVNAFSHEISARCLPFNQLVGDCLVKCLILDVI